jgi:septal ring factor EnvC (AmiA/AmiB activator)
MDGLKSPPSRGVNLVNAPSMKLLFLFASLIPLPGLSQDQVNNKPVDNRAGNAETRAITEKQKTLTKEISNLVELTKTQLTQLASLQNQLADRKTKVQAIDKTARTAEEEITYQNLKKEIEDLQSRIKKIDAEKEETNRKISAFQKELASCDNQVNDIFLNKAAALFGRTQLLLDSLPPSERKLDPQENFVLDHYNNLYKSSAAFQQKVKQYWKANTPPDQPNQITKARERKSLSPELQQALRDRIKEYLQELNSLQQETAFANHR